MTREDVSQRVLDAIGEEVEDRLGIDVERLSGLVDAFYAVAPEHVHREPEEVR